MTRINLPGPRKTKPAPPAALTNVQRQAKYRERGKPLNLVILDPDARKALERGRKKEGGYRAAIEAAVLAHYPPK